MTFKRWAAAGAGVMALCGAAGAAHAEIKPSATIGFYSDYRLRGVSLSDKTPVMQGGIEFGVPLTDTVSAFAGAWGSSLDEDAGAGALEADLYVGVTGKAGSLGWKATYLRIVFPDDPVEIDFDQYAFGLTFPIGPLGGSAGVVHDEYKGGTQSTYVYGAASYAFPDTPYAVKATLGYEDGDPYKEKWSWGLGATATYKNITFGVEYIDTDTKVTSATGKDLADSTAVISISTGF